MSAEVLTKSSVRENIRQTPEQQRNIQRLYGWIEKKMNVEGHENFRFTPNQTFHDLAVNVNDTGNSHKAVMEFLLRGSEQKKEENQIIAAKTIIFDPHTKGPGKINQCGDLFIQDKKIPLHGELKWTKAVLVLLTDEKYSLAESLQAFSLMGTLVKGHPFYAKEMQALEEANDPRNILIAFENLRARHTEACLWSAELLKADNLQGIQHDDIDFGIKGGGHHAHDHHDHVHEEHDHENSVEYTEQELLQIIDEAYLKSGLGLLLNGMKRDADMELDSSIYKLYSFDTYDTKKPATESLRKVNEEATNKLLKSVSIARNTIDDIENDHVALALSLIHEKHITISQVHQIQKELLALEVQDITKLSHQQLAVLFGTIGELQTRFEEDHVLSIDRLLTRTDITSEQRKLLRIAKAVQDILGFFIIHNTPLSMQQHKGLLHAKEIKGVAVACTAHAHEAKEVASETKQSAENQVQSVKQRLQEKKLQNQQIQKAILPIVDRRIPLGAVAAFYNQRLVGTTSPNKALLQSTSSEVKVFANGQPKETSLPNSRPTRKTSSPISKGNEPKREGVFPRIPLAQGTSSETFRQTFSSSIAPITREGTSISMKQSGLDSTSSERAQIETPKSHSQPFSGEIRVNGTPVTTWHMPIEVSRSSKKRVTTQKDSPRTQGSFDSQGSTTEIHAPIAQTSVIKHVEIGSVLREVSAIPTQATERAESAPLRTTSRKTTQSVSQQQFTQDLKRVVEEKLQSATVPVSVQQADDVAGIPVQVKKLGRTQVQAFPSQMAAFAGFNSADGRSLRETILAAL